jgi:phage-related protein
MQIEVHYSVEKFIESLPKETIAKSLKTIQLLERFDRNLGMPHVKKISGRIFELRIFGKQKVRIFFVFHGPKIILVHGFIKKTQKIPKNEMEVVHKRIKALDLI